MAARKQAIRRLMKDQEEMTLSPVTNVSAAPLDSNIFEWHCNIQADKNIYHVILFFPENYPYSSPSAEFVPSGVNYTQGAVRKGEKGDKVCLSIFSDFADLHREWKNESGFGWSPGYTAQTVLMNVVSFMAENGMTSGPDAERYHRFCRQYTCQDCGHTLKKPFPSLTMYKQTDKVDVQHVSPETQIKHDRQIIDYMSKETFQPTKRPSRDELFGYGLVVTQRGHKVSITTPCEFLTTGTYYGMKKSTGVVHSVMKKKVSHFLPLYINDLHGSRIKVEFEKTLSELSPLLFSAGMELSSSDIILNLIPNLMCSTVIEFSKGIKDTSENSLQGYFALHRLFLWAMEMYPELEAKVDQELSSFISNPNSRNKDNCPDIGQWLMLLTVSSKFSWASVAEAYLSECQRRNVMWYVQTDEKLGCTTTPKDYRLKRTFELTAVSRNLLMFQVAFLKIAKPEEMSKSDILDRYERNLGFPTAKMVAEMKAICRTIDQKVKDYADFYKTLGLQTPTMDSLYDTLMDSLIYSKATKGYHFTARQRRR